MNKIVAIDSSTRKTGMSYFEDGNLINHGLIDLSKETSDTEERIKIMGSKILQALNVWHPDTVYIEQAQGQGKNVALVRKLSELIGFAKAWAVMNGATIEEVPPSVWRKYVGIDQGKKKRAELKAESIRLVKETYGLDVGDDEADAICIGIAMINKQKEVDNNDKG